jgi:hypothetical protein
MEQILEHIYKSLEEAMEKSRCPAYDCIGACVGLSYCPNGSADTVSCDVKKFVGKK